VSRHDTTVPWLTSVTQWTDADIKILAFAATQTTMPDDASTNFFDAFKLEAMRADHHGAPSASDQPKRRLVVHNPLPVSEPSFQCVDERHRLTYTPIDIHPPSKVSVEVYLLTGE
jgi:hypothetical protein